VGLKAELESAVSSAYRELVLRVTIRTIIRWTRRWLWKATPLHWQHNIIPEVTKVRQK